jgi:hypothetical protein
MDDADHSELTAKLLACPEHQHEQIPQTATSDGSDLPIDKVAVEATIFKDKDGWQTVGFCLWCNQDLYSMGEV